MNTCFASPEILVDSQIMEARLLCFISSRAEPTGKYYSRRRIYKYNEDDSRSVNYCKKQNFLNFTTNFLQFLKIASCTVEP